MNQKPAYRSSEGFALIAVLWLVAAMSVLVGGIMLTVRAELKTAGLSRQTIVAQAVGEGAMQIALQELKASGKPVDKILEAPISYGGREIMVRLIPMNGYIDLNKAPLELLQGHSSSPVDSIKGPPAVWPPWWTRDARNPDHRAGRRGSRQWKTCC